MRLQTSRHFLILLLLAGGLMGGPCAAQNHIQNMQYNSELAGWAWEESGGATCSLDEQHHWGRACVRLTSRGGPAKFTKRMTGLTAGKTYYAYFWCTGAGVGAGSALEVGAMGRAALPLGIYGWRCVELGFVADAAAVDVSVEVRGKAAALWADDFYVTDRRRVNAGAVGVRADTGADVTAALQAAINAHPFLSLPAGVYRLSAPVRLPLGAMLWGDGAVLQETDAGDKAHLLESIGTAKAYAGDAEVDGVQFVGIARKYQYGVYLAKARNVLVQGCSTRYCALVDAEALKGYKQVASEDDLNRNIVISSNDVEATPEDKGAAEGILLRYTADARIDGNTVNFFNQGIEWWGGDSAFEQDGALANPRWARRIKVTGNTVTNSGGGGIWGSMGQDVRVAGNRVRGCDDVGIDFEGCLDSVAEANTVADARNGGLSVFFVTKGITFRGNTVSTSRADWPLFRAYNSSLDPTFGTGRLVGMGCLLDGNTFLCTAGIGLIDDHNGPDALTFRGNTLSNVRLNISHVGTGLNSLAPAVIGNTLTFRTDAPDFFAGINIFSSMGDPVVTGNTVTYAGAAGATKTGIQVQTRPDLSSSIRVDGNTVRGFGLSDISVFCYPGGKNTATISGNRVAGGKIVAGPPGAVTARAKGNTDAGGAAVPVRAAGETERPENVILP